MPDRPDPIDLMNRRLMNLPGTANLINRGVDTCEALREALRASEAEYNAWRDEMVRRKP